MRRFVGAAGAALVVLAFVAFMVEGSMESLPHPWLPIATLGMVPVGFVLLWEAQIAWPEDGRPYPWRRRLAGLAVGVATVAAAVITRGLLTLGLPDHWVAHTIATVAGFVAGDAVLRRLRRAFAGRLRQIPSPGESAGAG